MKLKKGCQFLSIYQLKMNQFLRLILFPKLLWAWNFWKNTLNTHLNTLRIFHGTHGWEAFPDLSICYWLDFMGWVEWLKYLIWYYIPLYISVTLFNLLSLLVSKIELVNILWIQTTCGLLFLGFGTGWTQFVLTLFVVQL